MGLTVPLTLGRKGDAEYSVRSFQHGAAVFGSIPVPELVALIGAWKECGWTHMDLMIASCLGASIAITGGDAQAKWREELKVGDANPDWLRSGDTGTSSMTIYAALTGEWRTLDRGMDGADTPKDPDDFGRCYRLLKRFPEWRARLGEVAEKFPAWGPLVREWDQMTKLYERDAPEHTGSSPELYELMTKLVDEGRARHAP